MSGGYLAVIPARAGSKRLLGKNIKSFCGKPLIHWSIASALQCTRIDRILVSTDSPDYQQLVVHQGADCPWLRAPSLSTDNTSSVDVVNDVIQRLGKEIAQYRALILLQPTSPLRAVSDIDHALDLYESSGPPAVISVCETECPRELLGRISENLLLDDFIDPYSKLSFSQDIKSWYRINGAIYIIDIEVFQRCKSFIPAGSLAFRMPRVRSFDIDTQLDFDLAQFVMQSSHNPSLL